MSEKKTIIILANSIRSGDRCIAGKELTKKEDGSYDVGPWIRLADHTTKEGAVPARLAYCPGHGWVQNLDIVSVTLEGRCNILAGGCLLCSEDKPHQCHRRLVVEYLQRHWGNLDIKHIV